MRRALLSLLLATGPVACTTRSVEPEGRVARVETIFDGRTLVGWDGDPRFWSVQDGAIVGESTPATPCTETTYLVWRGAEVRDFELRLEFRIDGGNSGVQFRSRDLGGWRVAGYQADLEDGPSWTGCLYEQDGRGVIATRGERVVLRATGRDAQRVGDAAALLAAIEPRAWHEYAIRAIGERIELAIDGVRMLELVDRDESRRSLGGLLAFQLHSGPPMRIALRNVRLERLASPPNAPVLAVASLAPEPQPQSQPARPWSGTPPQWIWADSTTEDGEVVALERRFEIPGPIARAMLRASADNHVRVFVNGEDAAEHDDWETAVERDVSAFLRRGENTVVLLARNDGSFAGAWLELVVEDPAGRRVRVVSDGSWTAARLADGAEHEHWEPSAFDAARSGPAHSFGAFGVAPWTSASAGPAPAQVDEPETHALAADALELPHGFRAELVHEVQKRAQGSWVTLCEDPRGRFYVGDQHGGLYRVTPARPGEGAQATRVEPVDLAIGSAQGLCWAFDSLYVVVAERDEGRVCGLYRLRDSDGDDRLDAIELVREFDGSGEHGPHAVLHGSDGALWVVGGNHTKLPEPIDASRVPRTWAEDLLLPRIDDPNGHAVGILAPGGWIVRTDERGARWELVAAGLRNAYDLAFDARGEAFTFDSDMEWDVGAPWYRPTRILHVASGADYGWRNGSGKWPADWPDTWPSACDVGRTSPTGVTFGTGASFPERYQRALFACDWAFGTIYAIHLAPSGSSWRGEAEVFARGAPFAVTDAVVARDGALYVTTGGRNTQSGLYRITWTGALDGGGSTAAPLTTRQLMRRALEALHERRARTASEIELVARGLGSADRFLAGAARIALEHTPREQWDAVRDECAGALAMSRFVLAELHAGPADPARTLDRLTDLARDRSGAVSRVDVLRLIELALLRLDPPPLWRDAIRENLALAFPSGDARLDRASAQILAYLDAPDLAQSVLERIDAATLQEDAIHYAYCLRVVRASWRPELRARFLAFLDGRARSFRGGASLEKYVAAIRREFVESLTDAERAELGVSIAAPAAAAPAAAPAVFVRRWTRAELFALLGERTGAGSADAGRAAFEKATCASCHRVGSSGGATGPDLSGVAARFGLGDLLDTIVEPSRTISDQYRDVELRTSDGDLYVGRIERDDGRVIVLRRTPGDERVEIEASEVEMRRPYPLSRMPSGLLDVLDEAEVLDLFAYLRSGAASIPAGARR